MDTAIEFLKFVRPEGPWTLTAIHPDGSEPIETKTFAADNEGEAAGWISFKNKTRNIYWGANPTLRDEDKKASRDNIRCMSLLHVDLDPRAGEDLAAEQSRILSLLTTNLPKGVPAPSVVIYSGGGYQALWLLEEPFQINGDVALADEAARYNMQLELLLGGDATHDVSRILRLPFTINIPGEKKLKKGRTRVMANVVTCPGTVYPLSQFIQAQRVQAMNGNEETRQLEISGNIQRLNGVDDLDTYTVPAKVKVLIVEGRDPKYPSRSEALWYVCCELLRCGVPPETIYSIITDPDFGISESVLEKGARADRYARQQIARAADEAEEPKLREYNQRHAVIRHHNNGCIVLTELVEPHSQQIEVHRASVQSFFNAYANDKFMARIPGKKRNWRTGEETATETEKLMSAPRWWFEHKNRREYDRIVFAPCREVPGAYNLWRGFACEAIPGDKHESFLRHVYENICCGVDEHYTYLLGWMARTVQRPYEQGLSAVVMCGGEGVGKSFFANTFGMLFGSHYMKVTQSSQLVGHFNGHMQDRVVLFADEGFYAGDKQHSNVLKDLITSEHLVVERKYEQAESSPNYIHLLMATNSDWVVPAGPDARRYFVLDVGAARRNDHKYFENINADLDAGGREALLAFFMSYDLSKFNVRDVPHTKALARQKEMSLSTEDAWWEEKLEEGLVFPIDSDWAQAVAPRALYDDYLLFAQKGRAYKPLTPAALYTYLVKATGGKVKKGRPRGDASRQRFWLLPTLEECRLAWDLRFRHEREWEGATEFDDALDHKASTRNIF